MSKLIIRARAVSRWPELSAPLFAVALTGYAGLGLGAAAIGGWTGLIAVFCLAAVAVALIIAAS